MKLALIIDERWPALVPYKHNFGLDEQDKSYHFNVEQNRIMNTYFDIIKGWW